MLSSIPHRVEKTHNFTSELPEKQDVTYSIFNTCKDTYPKQQARSFDDLADLCRKPVLRDDKDGKAFCPATFNGHRSNTNATECGFLAFDLDNLPDHVTAADVLAGVDGLLAFAYSSHNHLMPGKGARYRVVVAIDSPIHADQYTEIVRTFAKRFPWAGAVDNKCFNSSRLFYFPSCAADRAGLFEIERQEGALFDWKTLANSSITPPQIKPLKSGSSPFANIPSNLVPDVDRGKLAEALEFIEPEEYGTWLNVGMGLRELHQEGFLMWDKWSSQSDKYPGQKEMLNKWASFTSGGGVGLGTIFHLAKLNGFVLNPGVVSYAPDKHSYIGNLTTKQAIELCFADVVGVCSLAEWDIAGAVAYGVRDLFRWVDEKKSWVYLDCSTSVWFKDFRGLIRIAVAAYIERVEVVICKDIQHGGNDAENRKTLGRLARLKSRQSIDAVIELAKSMQGMTVSVTEFDVDVNVVAFNNGWLYDMNKCEARQIMPMDLVSKTLTVPYVQGATCPTWVRCWGDWFPDNPEIVGLMQRFMGYLLSGNINEQVLAYLYGPGQNGKGIVTSTINNLWGDLCCFLPQEALMVKKFGTDGPDSTFASVEGCLATVVPELEDGAVFRESFLKWITGGDPLTIQQKYEHSRKIIPKFKLVICGNVLPIVRGQDKGIWRRFLLIPFDKIITDDQKDPKLMDKLNAELPGIAQWCIQGWKEYKEIGLAVPQAIKTATEEYKNEMDVIGHFLSEETKIDEKVEIDSSTLYAQYSEWAKRNGHYCFNSAAFGRKLSGRGIRSKKVTGGKRKYLGLTLA